MILQTTQNIRFSDNYYLGIFSSKFEINPATESVFMAKNLRWVIYDPLRAQRVKRSDFHFFVLSCFSQTRVTEIFGYKSCKNSFEVIYIFFLIFQIVPVVPLSATVILNRNLTFVSSIVDNGNFSKDFSASIIQQ